MKCMATFTGRLSAKNSYSKKMIVRGDCIADVVIAIPSLNCELDFNIAGAKPWASSLILFY